jgi:hypothetical protein
LVQPRPITPTNTLKMKVLTSFCIGVWCDAGG